MTEKVKIKENETKFLEAYGKLNIEQKKAVDAIEGPVMVIAGPGTGKTQILTLRIANILRQTDTRPENILALTFTDSGVRAMRQRLTTFIGEEAYYVPIHTFHSFAGELIRNYPDSYKNIVGGRPASELEKREIIEELLEEKTFKRLRPHGDHRYYVKPILDAITTMKRENVSVAVFAEAIAIQEDGLRNIEKIHTKGAHKGKVRGEYLEAEKLVERNQELLYIYQRYVVTMKSLRLYDFEDMILDTVEALQNNEEMLFDVQERYQYILADEHQDVNKSQNKLIEIIASYHQSPNVFVVGDEKQAIYRFQGASLENFLFFENVYKSPVIISLTDNYRSDQDILDLAHDCILSDDSKLKDLRIPLVAKNKFKTEITKQNFSFRAVEDYWVIDQIKKQHDSGVSWQEIALIVRTNKEVEQFTSLLRKENIPALPSADSDILQHPIFLNIKNLIKSVVEFDNNVALAEVLQSPYLNIDRDDLIAIFMARNFAVSLWSIIGDESKLNSLKIKNPESFLKVYGFIKRAKELELTHTPAEVTEYLLRESGLLDFLLQESINDSLRVVRRLYDEIELMYQKKEAEDLKSVLNRLDLYGEYNLPLSAPFIEVAKDAVNILTAHKAKGLEFEVVILPHLTDNLWGGSVRASLFKLPIASIVVDEKAQAEDDEKRLFYVALTRAKRVLLCSYSIKNDEGRDLSPSRFLVGLNSEKISEMDITNYQNNFVPTTNLKSPAIATIDVDFLRINLEKRGWSATSFNNYCKSPWEYIYKNVLRIPTIKTPELQFGTAIHAVLEEVVRLLVLKHDISDSDIKKLLEAELSKLPFSVAEFTRNHERGLVALSAYIPLLKQKINLTAKTEYSLQVTLDTGLKDFPEVILTGNFDRLDFDFNGQLIRVVDYKTGKPKTRGEIEGKTKNSTGGYKRQLVFYALLLSLHKDENFHGTNCLLSFVEPDKKGILREEEFQITQDEITELKNQIISATKEVVTGECLKTLCDNKTCNYCHLVDIFTN